MNKDTNNLRNDNSTEANNTAKSLDEQEQANSAELVRDLESGELSDDDTIQEAESNIRPIEVENTRSLTRNQLGDNPPGSEEAAFNAGSIGDASAEQFKYNSENLVEGFRENINKTEDEIALDKKLKDQGLT